MMEAELAEGGEMPAADEGGPRGDKEKIQRVMDDELNKFAEIWIAEEFCSPEECEELIQGVYVDLGHASKSDRAILSRSDSPTTRVCAVSLRLSWHFASRTNSYIFRKICKTAHPEVLTAFASCSFDCSAFSSLTLSHPPCCLR